MVKKSYLILIVTSLLACLQLACLISFGPNEADSLATAVAKTLEVIQAENPPVGNPPLQEVQPVEKTPEPTQETIKEPTKTPKPCNAAIFISETIPDDSEFDANQAFTKSWRFKNTGTCTWNSNYKFVFKSGDQMGAPASKSLSSEVAPGETVDIAINMVAPASGGTYQNYWKFVDDEGQNMINNVWAKIIVPSEIFSVTSVNLSVAPPVFAGPCPFPFQFFAVITASGPGTVTYYWERNDGATFGNSAVVFASAGTKTVNTVWPEMIPGPHWMKIYIDNPNHQYFGTANYTLTCIP